METQSESVVTFALEIDSDPIWHSIRDYRLPFTGRYMQLKYGWNERFANACIVEYRRYVYLAMTADTEMTPSISVDEIWHTHILHTRDYDAFGVVLGRKLQHNPGVPSEQQKFDVQYEKTLMRYRNVFGCEAPVAVWPRQSRNVGMRAVLERLAAVKL